jgi:hypothetical protein
VYRTYTVPPAGREVSMASVQLSIPDDDRDRSVQLSEPFNSPEDLRSFFDECDTRRGVGTEPNWDEHLRTAEASRATGLPDD